MNQAKKDLADLTSADLLKAFNDLSVRVAQAFPKALPLQIYTVGGAMMVITLGSRPSTHDVDVAGGLLVGAYGHDYPDIKNQLAALCAQTYEALKGQGVDLGNAQWLNYGADWFVPNEKPVIEQAMADNIILFQNTSLVIRSVSYGQTIFNKLKRFQGKDVPDILAILTHLVGTAKLPGPKPSLVDVTEYLKKNVAPENAKELTVRAAAFNQKLEEVLAQMK